MKEKVPGKEVSGQRVFLRHIDLKDAAEFIAGSKSSARFHRKLVNPPKDIDSFKELLKKNESEANEVLLVCKKSSGAIMGAVVLSQIFHGVFKNAYLGYYLFEKYTGEGFMTEAIALVLRYAFRDLTLHRLEANIQPENLVSIRVVKRCGFGKEGFSRKYLKIGGKWRDHERWAIIREDWQP